MFTIFPSTISASFDQIANDLFNNYIIQVNNNFYRLIEIEFYYNDSKEHHDCACSGIDIAIGSEEASGGILLRSI